MGPAMLCEIHACDRTQPDSERLQDDGEDVRHQHDEQKAEASRSAGSDISRIISRVNVSHSDDKARADEFSNFGYRVPDLSSQIASWTMDLEEPFPRCVDLARGCFGWYRRPGFTARLGFSLAIVVHQRRWRSHSRRLNVIFAAITLRARIVCFFTGILICPQVDHAIQILPRGEIRR